MTLKKIVPKNYGDLVALLFLLAMIHLVALFELVVVIPTIHEEINAGFCFLVFIGLYIYLNVMYCLYLTMNTDTTSGSVVLPSILKPGWRFCSACECNAPPRSFHCWFCNVCVLKRDHHCIFTGNCIGHANLRYFLQFMMFMTIGSMYCNFLNVDYTLEIIGDLSLKSIFTMIVPLFSWLIGVSETYTFSVAFISASCLLGFLLLGGFLIYHMANLSVGQTCHEKSRNIKNYNLGWNENIKQVLGVNWYYAWLSPLISSPLPGNGIDFEETKTYESVKNM